MLNTAVGIYNIRLVGWWINGMRDVCKSIKSIFLYYVFIYDDGM